MMLDSDLLFEVFELLLGPRYFIVVIMSASVCIAVSFLWKMFNQKVQKSDHMFRSQDLMEYSRKKFLRQFSKYKKKVDKVKGEKGSGFGTAVKLAKMVLALDNPVPKPKLSIPPPELVETALNSSAFNLPEDTLTLLKDVRIFCHLDAAVFNDLCKHIVIQTYEAGECVFGNDCGDEDAIYVVKSGKISLNFEGLLIKSAVTGEHIYSLIAILESITGMDPKPTDLSCYAVQDSVVLKLKSKDMKEVLALQHGAFLETIQVIMMRLQRITFMALYNYLGLSCELLSDPKRIEMPDQYPFPIKPETQKNEARALALEFRRVRTKNPGSHFGPDVRLLDMSVSDILFSLKLENPEPIRKALLEAGSVHEYKAGKTVVSAGCYNPDLIFVVSGQLLSVTQAMDEDKEEPFFATPSGFLLGQLALLSGEPSFFQVKARSDCLIVRFRQDACRKLCLQHSNFAIKLAQGIVHEMNPFTKVIDFAIDWVYVESGRLLYRQGEQATAVYIVMNGRVRQISSSNVGVKSIVSEHGRGELIGILETITEKRRPTSLLTVRDTELAKIPAELLALLKKRYPRISIHLLSHQAVLSTLSPSHPTMRSMFTDAPDQVDGEAGGMMAPDFGNLNTVAVIALHPDVPLSCFTLELQHNLNAIGACLRLASSIVVAQLGGNADVLEKSQQYRLCSWLSAQEELHRITIYQCDRTMTPWTERCLRQADCVLLVTLANSAANFKPNALEDEIRAIAPRAQKDLVLLHKEGVRYPIRTQQWLIDRAWLHTHHHIRAPQRIFKHKTYRSIKHMYEKVFDSKPNHMCDFARLSRYLTGTSVGLVLGGGGARGISHLGIIKALVDAGVPIDMVGGTSMGAFMGALWSKFTDPPQVTRSAREWCDGMSQLWRKILDLTYPITSMFSGAGFNSGIFQQLGHSQIEDLWLPYFCVSTNVTSSQIRIHRSGSLWRYVRASMSLAGYLPPLCDPSDGHLLLDGGYVNNLPADVCRQLGARVVIAVDVGSMVDSDLTNYGDQLSGWWLLWKRFNPWASTVKVPNMDEIQARLCYVGSTQLLNQVKAQPNTVVLRPPIQHYKTLQFASFEPIEKVGLDYGTKFLSYIDTERFLSHLYDPVTPTVHELMLGYRRHLLIHHPADKAEVFSRKSSLVFPTPSAEDVTDSCSSPLMSPSGADLHSMRRNDTLDNLAQFMASLQRDSVVPTTPTTPFGGVPGGQPLSAPTNSGGRHRSDIAARSPRTPPPGLRPLLAPREALTSDTDVWPAEEDYLLSSLDLLDDEDDTFYDDAGHGRVGSKPFRRRRRSSVSAQNTGSNGAELQRATSTTNL